MTELPKLINFLKMKMKVLRVFLLLSLTALAGDVHTAMTTKKCMSSEDCGENYVCSEGVCHSCFNCSLLFREGPSCIIDFKQCGSCMKGYKDFAVTDFSTVIKPCEKIESKAYSYECLNDHHCPFENYCHEKTCVRCFDCSLYNRLSPTQNCAREPQDCSSCLNGFYEVPVTTETNPKPCQKIMSNSIQNVSWTEFLNQSSSSTNIAWILLCVLGVNVIVFILVYKRRAERSKEVIAVQCHSPRPPPYPSEICQHIHEAEPEVEEEESSFFTFVEEKQQQNMAKVFRLPEASYYYGSEDDVDNLFENCLEDEEEDANSDAVENGIQRQSDERLLSNDNETRCAEEVNDFVVVSESEINNASVGELNMTDSANTTHAVDECSSTLEESKNPNKGEELEQREKNEK